MTPSNWRIASAIVGTLGGPTQDVLPHTGHTSGVHNGVCLLLTPLILVSCSHIAAINFLSEN
jgi:hypothetical protein